jgi:hypothetical protein
MFASLSALACLASACVSSTRYEEALSAADVEREGHRRASTELAEVEAKLAKAEVELLSKAKELESRESALAQSELDANAVGRERDDAEILVRQLTEELTRLGGHMQVYSDERRALSDDLAAAEARLARLNTLERQSTRLMGATRDLSLLLSGPLTVGIIALDVDGDALRVRGSAAALQTAAKPGAPPPSDIPQAIARLARLYPAARFEITAGPSATPNAHDLSERLIEQGVDASRVRARSMAPDHAELAGNPGGFEVLIQFGENQPSQAGAGKSRGADEPSTDFSDLTADG